MQMKVPSRFAVLVFAIAASCAALRSEMHESPLAVLDAAGIAPPAMTVDSWGTVTFLNGDSRLHQIYSPECPELDSTLLQPGESFRAALGAGPKVCHFQDLLAPSVAAYAGTVEVRRGRPDPLSVDSPS
jgi:hypothetical protein